MSSVLCSPPHVRLSKTKDVIGRLDYLGRQLDDSDTKILGFG